jgi:hypothetical protein
MRQELHGRRAATVPQRALTNHAGGAELPTRPGKAALEAADIADKKGIQILFLYITVAKYQKTARTVANIDCIRVLSN